MSPNSHNLPYIPATGNSHAKLLILGEAPWKDEIIAGKPFVGASGKELDRLLSDAGINRSDCWISNVCKYPVPPPPADKKIPFKVRAEHIGIDLDKELNDLQTEINNIKPNCILALGGTALWATTGKLKIGQFRGSILHGMGRKVVATYHPAHLLYSAKGGEIKGYWNRQVMILDMKRALDESRTSELELPSRNLQVCKTSAQLSDFIARYKFSSYPAIDIEANGRCIPACIGISFNPYEGLTVPLWNEGTLIPKSEIVQMWLLLSELLSNSDVIGQNFKYDQDKIRRLGFIIKSLYSDTMLKAFTINPELPKGLAFNTSIYTREPFYKDEGMYEGSDEDLYIGCARDACVTKEIDLAMDSDIDELGLRNFYQNFILKLHDLYLDIENEGFYINTDKRALLIEKYVKWSERLSYEIYKLVGDNVNVNSPKQVSLLLYDNLGLPRRNGTGEEELTALLNNQSGAKNPVHRRILEIILEKRKVDKTIGNYLMALPDYDGKMKTTYFLCLETGRTSTGQLEPPIRPPLEYKDEENKKKKKVIGTAFQTITKHGDVGNDVRSQYIPEKGYVLLQADSAQAEARVVFLLADDEQALIDIDTHDYHALTTSWFIGGTEADYSKKVLGYESPQRFMGKTLRHAGHLGAGKRRAAISVNTDARKYKVIDPKTGELLKIQEAFAEIALKIFHRKQPKIREGFHNGIISYLEKDKRFLTAALPYGIDSKVGGKRQFFERWGDELFRQAFSYIPQRTISDNTKAAGLRLKKRDSSLRIIMESHDALLFMIKENEVQNLAPMIKEEMERPLRFENCSLSRRDLIIPCEIEIGENYQDFEKFKFNEIVNV